MQATKFFALGGLQEIGKTTLVVEHEEEIVIIDAGIKFTNSMETGVDGIIPDYTYLHENQKKIKGLFITHGHEDHIGGIPYLIQQVDIKTIHAPAFAIALIQERLRDKKIKRDIEYIEITKDGKFSFDKLSVDFWTSQHSIPDSFGIRVKTPNGVIMDTGDFRFDYTPIGNMTDFSKLEEMGKEGVDIMISDSTNSMSPEHSPTEQNILIDIEKEIKNAKGKVFFTTFASNINRVKAVIDLAAKNKRRVCAFGRSMIKNIDIARKLKFIDVPESVFVDKRDISKLSDKEILILSTGSQGEEMANLSRVAEGKQNWVTIGKEDIILFSSSPIPGNHMKIELLVNKLYKQGANVKENKIDGIFHTSGHAYKDEHDKIFEIVKPKYFVPYHGAYRQSAVHGYTSTENGVKKENVFIIENGDVLLLKDHVVTKSKERIDPGPIYIDSGVATRDTSAAINAREELGRNGFINVVVTINKNKNEIVGRTRVVSRGALYIKTSQEIMQEIQKKAHGAILFTIKNNKDWTTADIKKIVAERIQPYFYKIRRRNPIIITSVMFLDKQNKLTTLKKKGQSQGHSNQNNRNQNRRPHNNQQNKTVAKPTNTQNKKETN